MEPYVLGYKFRIYPNKTQQRLINRTLGCCRFVYNHFLAVRRDQWQANHRSVSYFETCKLLTDLKRQEETSWLKEADSMALQESLRNLDNAFQNFWKLHTGYPRFKSKHSHSQSYRTRNQKNGIRIVDKRIKLPKIGFVKIKQSRDCNGRILSVTISRTASGKYFVSLCMEQDKENLVRSNAGGMIGIDVGIRAFYTDSLGHIVENPRHLNRFLTKLKREQRRLSRKMPKSQNRDKARIRVARIHEKIANIRKDFLHKHSTQLARENQTIAVEQLNIKGMLRNHKLAQAISDVSWSEFFRQLTYKTELHGGELLKVDTFYPSSQTCSVCGYQNALAKDLSVREWDCPECGMHHDRDVNAAKNILRKALEDKSKVA
ncbi:IS200/IS605 family element RNA-guided endonuclease TnpB [Mitsuokella multacida]|uniref:IS200/IS605 family element RNA-guided endonuclease TnpB n=1 Tax=Mitsuokella multacida TaxID=52226 RepID=UPI00241DFCF8|nr:IS200/IS605 family element RNA-guided endonuclease TnpB [Mitsuokella multacida]